MCLKQPYIDMSKIILLVDWKRSDKFFLEEQFEKRSIDCELVDIPNYDMRDRISKFRVLNLYRKYVNLAYRGIRSSNPEDIILCWNFTTSIAVGYLCKIMRIRRNIVALNIIAPERSGLLGVFRNSLFHRVMNSNRFWITVNSSHLIERYSKQFSIARTKFFELPDPIQTTSITPVKVSEGKKYVFCGGEAKRDWGTLFKACLLTPNVSYVAVARQKYFDKALQVPQNVTLLFDIDKTTFNKYLEESYLVALPLNSSVPAGLIILLSSALNGKAVIATDTPSIRNYIEDGRTGLLVGMKDHVKLAEGIEYLIKREATRNELANNLQDFIIENFSPDKYGNRLTNILKGLNLIN